MSDFIGQPQILKAVNTAKIEQLILERGPLSKPELARLTGLSLPTVSKLVDDLENGRNIRPVGLSGKGAGRKAMLYEINKDSGCLLVLYYHGGAYAGRVTDITGKTLYKEAFPLDPATAKTAFSGTLSAIDTLLKKAPNPVSAIGIGVPGVVQPDGRLLGIPKIPSWDGFNLAGALAEQYPIGTCIENDVKLSAVGYYLTHLSEEYENIVYIYAGEGMGAGIIINGKLYRGANNFSGELGFMAPLTGKPPEKDYTGIGGYLESELIGSVQCGNKVFSDTVSQREALANTLGAAAANHVAVLNPDVLVFGGEAFDEALIQQIHAQMAFYTPGDSMPLIQLDDNESTGINGLVLTCRGYITTRLQLVQNGGV
ncbi:MAG: ROK family transcriptional regulator [Clostridia bacterium]|nr:ROK family transcriptional regulator [Clostridia bacterium]